MGDYSAEFAAKWREKLAPDQVKMGRQLSKETSKNVKTYQKTQLNPSSEVRNQGVKNAIKKDFDLKDKIKQVQGSAKAQKSELFKSNSPDKLIKQNKNLRSYLENRKINNYRGNTKLGKATTAPKTIKRASTGMKRVMANQKAVANQKFGQEIKEAIKQPTPTPTPTPSRPVPSKPLPSIPKRNIPKPQLNSIPYKKTSLLDKVGRAIRTNPVAAGAGLGAMGAGIGYGAYKKMKDNKNK